MIYISQTQHEFERRRETNAYGVVQNVNRLARVDIEFCGSEDELLALLFAVDQLAKANGGVVESPTALLEALAP